MAWTSNSHLTLNFSTCSPPEHRSLSFCYLSFLSLSLSFYHFCNPTSSSSSRLSVSLLHLVLLTPFTLLFLPFLPSSVLSSCFQSGLVAPVLSNLSSPSPVLRLSSGESASYYAKRMPPLLPPPLPPPPPPPPPSSFPSSLPSLAPLRAPEHPTESQVRVGGRSSVTDP